jgi:hypothetical protein
VKLNTHLRGINGMHLMWLSMKHKKMRGNTG